MATALHSLTSVQSAAYRARRRPGSGVRARHRPACSPTSASLVPQGLMSIWQGEAEEGLKAAEAAADAEVAASIGGGYSKPDVRELLGAQIAMLPVTLYKARLVLCSACLASPR